MFRQAVIAAALITAAGLESSQPAFARPIVCAPLAGADQLWASSTTRFVLVGEIHGTAETAPMVADIVCLAAQGRRVIVALELDRARQADVDAYLGSAGDEPARARLGFGGAWTGLSDGRTSEAEFGLIERVRLMQAAGLPVSVVLIDLAPGSPGAERDPAMADALEGAARADPDALVIALTGNYHASRIQRVRDGRLRLSTAAILGRARTVSLDVGSVRGAAWFCGQDGCGPHILASTDPPPARGIRAADPRETTEVDFLYSPGVDFTASPPVGFAADQP